MAGINTAVTGVGTVAGGVALGTGLAKAGVDEAQRDMIDKWMQENKNIPVEELLADEIKLKVQIDELAKKTATKAKADTLRDIENLEKKSKILGNVRTGTMAGAAVADTAGTIMALNNRLDEALQNQIENCIAAVDTLDNERMRARAENTATEEELAVADKIISGCTDWKNVDLSSVDKRATGAAISGGAGAVMGIAGTITSAKANSSEVRNDNTTEGKSKEQNLNTVSNVLAGGTTVASAVATVFNATQISAIKKAVAAADKCEEALR